MKVHFLCGASHFNIPLSSMTFLTYDISKMTHLKVIYQPIIIFVYSPLLEGFRRVYTF